MRLFCKLISAIITANLLLGSGIVCEIYAQNDSVNEEKIPCTATLEEEFAENRVMVVMSNQTSRQFNRYNAEDFSEINCVSVSDLSTATEAKLKAAQASVSVSEKDNAINRASCVDIDDYNQVLCLELKDAGKENVLKAIEQLQKRDDIIYAGPDYVIKSCSTTPDDSLYSQQWAPDKIQLPQAWDNTTGSSSVIVGVMDSGIEGTHPDLIDNLNTELCRDFTSGQAVAVTPTDTYGHGTAVAGVIGAQGDNTIGVTGACWDVTLVSLRVLLSDSSGFSSWVALAINYAESQGIQILNLSASWTSATVYPYYNRELESVIQNYSGLVICAAGNDEQNNNTNTLHPGNYNLPNLITVGASNVNDSMHEESNYGKNTVDLFAPGKEIYTTFINHEYIMIGGTSFAAPYVTGVAALLLSAHPDLLPCEIKDTILSNVDLVGSLTDYCVTGGRLNAYNALTNVQRHANIDENPTNAGHVRICTAHTQSKTLPHSYTYVSNGSSGHISTCSDCGFSVSNEHNMIYHNTGVDSGHTGMCKNCNYTCSEAHTWVSAGSKYRCTKCGVSAIHAPVTPFSLSPEIRARIEQMALIGDFAMDIGGGTVLCRVGDQYYLVAGQTEATALSYLQHELSVITPDHEAA